MYTGAFFVFLIMIFIYPSRAPQDGATGLDSTNQASDSIPLFEDYEYETRDTLLNDQ